MTTVRVRGVEPRPLRRALLTGASGTVGRALRAVLEAGGTEVVGWDRAAVPIDDYHAMERFVAGVDPDTIFHLATAATPTRPDDGWRVSVHWSNELAWIAKMQSRKLVFTSTALVFTPEAPGPYTLERAPDCREGYGDDKRRAEERLFHQNPDVAVARLGWQIGDGSGANDMVRALRDQAREGPIRASRRWIPACSFLQDTARVLRLLGASDARGVHHVDANARTAWSYDRIVAGLAASLGEDWAVEPDEAYVHDQRLIDERVELPSIEERLRSG